MVSLPVSGPMFFLGVSVHDVTSYMWYHVLLGGLCPDGGSLSGGGSLSIGRSLSKEEFFVTRGVSARR